MKLCMGRRQRRPRRAQPTTRNKRALNAPRPAASGGRDRRATRANGGRGFGFTGGHFHDNWGNDSFRKVVLNAMLWIAKGEVPADGIESVVTPEQLNQNLDPKPSR